MKVESQELDRIVLDALQECSEYLAAHPWRGRENELVNLFAFGHLLPRACAPRGPLDPTQIAIEVAVPQFPQKGRQTKASVRKDLVLWRAPRMTNWMQHASAESRLLAVMEWKSLNNVGATEKVARKRAEHAYDIDWLCEASRREEGMTGYAVFANLTQSPPALTVTVVRDGQVVVPARRMGQS